MKKIVAIDCTWFQTKKMIESLPQNSPLDQKIRFVKLEGDYQTTFWRYQHNSAKCLATAEAIYYFYKELKENRKEIDGVENIEHILFFYAIQFEKVFMHYKKDNVYCGKNKEFFHGLKKIKE